MENILNEVEGFISNLDGFWTFIISCSLVVFAFLFNLIFAILRSGYNTKKRCTFLVFSAVVIFLESAILLKKGSEYLIYATISLSLLSFIPLLFIRVKSGKKKQVELARYIDDKIRKASEDQEKQPTILKCQPEPPKVQKSEVNFSHVKNVIERLNYYALSPFDRKQVNDLSTFLTEAERVGITQELKEKINDGLGILLKIMSKYGV